MNVAIRRCAWAARASTFCAASAGMGYSMRAGGGLALLCPPAGCGVLRVRRRTPKMWRACEPTRGWRTSLIGQVPRQHPAHGLYEVCFWNGNLRRAGLAPLLGVLDGGGGLGALDQILDLYLPARDLVRSLDDDAGTAALVRVLHLRLHAGAAEIHLRAHSRGPQALREPLEPRQVGSVHHQYHDRAQSTASLRRADGRQRRLQSRYADREAGGRHALAREAGDEIVVASPAADRAETHELSLVVAALEGELRLEHRTRVVVETAHHAGVHGNAIACIACGCEQPLHFGELGKAGAADVGTPHQRLDGSERLARSLRSRADEAQHRIHRARVETRARSKIARLILAA